MLSERPEALAWEYLFPESNVRLALIKNMQKNATSFWEAENSEQKAKRTALMLCGQIELDVPYNI